MNFSERLKVDQELCIGHKPELALFENGDQVVCQVRSSQLIELYLVLQMNVDIYHEMSKRLYDIETKYSFNKQCETKRGLITEQVRYVEYLFLRFRMCVIDEVMGDELYEDYHWDDRSGESYYNFYITQRYLLVGRYSKSWVEKFQQQLNS